MRITDLEAFAINVLFRPYCTTFDHKIWELEYKQNDRVSAYKLQVRYEREIIKDLSILVKWLEENQEFKQCVFKRLKAIDKTNRLTFPTYIQHPLKDYVIKKLEETADENNS